MLMHIFVSSTYAQIINMPQSNLSIITGNQHTQFVISDCDVVIEKEHNFCFNFDELLLSPGTLRRIIWYGVDKQILRVYADSSLNCYKYNEKGKLVEASEYRCDHCNLDIFFREDLKEQLVQRKKIKYQYNDKEQINVIIAYTSNGDAQKRTCEYDKSGRINLIGDKILKYDDQGRIIGVRSTNLDKQGYYYEIYDYSNQLLSKYSQGYIQNTESKREKEFFYEYENDENGNWITCRCYIPNNNKVNGKEYISIYTREYHKSRDLKNTIKATNEYNNEIENDDNIYEKVDDLPQFPEGSAQRWVAKNVRYPMIAQENNIQGKVFVQFVVEKDGSVSNVKVAKSVDPSLDKEAIRMVKAMPKWEPAKLRGKPVRVSCTIPIGFSLQ